MAVSLAVFLPSFQYEINPPGQNLYPNMSDDEALQRLIDAFWSLRLSGLDFLAGFTCDDGGTISPQNSSNVPQGFQNYIPVAWFEDGTTGDIGREIIQAVLLFAHLKVLVAVMENANTSTTYKAGPVESSVSKSSSVYQAALKAVTSQIDIVLTRLSDLGSTNVTVLDAVIDSTMAISTGDQWWTR